MSNTTQNTNSSQSQPQTDNEPGFFHKHWKSISVCTVAVVAATVSAVYFIYKK